MNLSSFFGGMRWGGWASTVFQLAVAKLTEPNPFPENLLSRMLKIEILNRRLLKPDVFYFYLFIIIIFFLRGVLETI